MSYVSLLLAKLRTILIGAAGAFHLLYVLLQLEYCPIFLSYDMLHYHYRIIYVRSQSRSSQVLPRRGPFRSTIRDVIKSLS